MDTRTSHTQTPDVERPPLHLIEQVLLLTEHCVANMPGAVPNTSTYALTNATLPYVVALADKGWQRALREDRSLALGLNTHAGQLTNAPVAEAHGLASVTPADVLV